MDKPPTSSSKQPGETTAATETASSTLIPLIVLIIFIVFALWMVILLFGSRFKTTSTENPVSSDSNSANSQFFITCPAGSCAVNLQSGFKTCPTTDVPIQVNPAESFCAPRYACVTPNPFAVQSDGSTNINGLCEPGVECPCLNVSQCANYVLSAFTTSNGNPYQDFSSQRILFPQISSYVTANGDNTTIPPIQFSNPATTFCAAPPSWLPLSNPGCNFVNANDPNSMNYDDILFCMGMINGCSGVTGSPCLQGTLAFVTNNPESLTQTNVDTALLACVSGDPCPCNYAAIYDTNYGGLICKQLPP